MVKTSTPTATKKKRELAVPVQASAAPAVPAPKRRIKIPTYKSFKLQKRITNDAPRQVPSAMKLFRNSFGILRRNWKLFLGITAVYAFLNLVLVSSFSAVNLTEAKQAFDQTVDGSGNQLTIALSLFAYLLSGSGATSTPTASVYQLMLGVILSLAILWALRQVYTDNKPRVRDVFYQGMYPLVPFVLVLLVIGLETLPVVGGAFLYGTVVGGGIAATAVEQAMWLVLFGVLALVTIYLLCSTLFALYVVTLPGMTPIVAMRSARQLVQHRRWTIVRKILFLPLAVIVLAGIILTPLILFATPVAPWVFFGLSMLLLPIVHGYLYALYRSLL